MKKYRFSFKPLFRIIKKKRIPQRDLKTDMNRLKRGGNMTMITLARLMKVIGETDTHNVVKIDIED